MCWLKYLFKPKTEAGIKPCGTINIHTMSSILLDKLEEIGSEAEIYLPDTDCKAYSRTNVVDFLHLDDTSEIKYVAETMDCDDYAAILFGKFAGLVWTQNHALNCFVSSRGILYFIEPQTNEISEHLDKENKIRFIIMR